MKKMYLIRGVQGSGKSTFAKSICDNVFEPDDYFTDDDGYYKFIQANHGAAKEDCLARARVFVESGKDVAIASTFSKSVDMYGYEVLALLYNYTVFSIIVENRHNGENIHGVPDHVVNTIRDQFEICL